MYMDDSNVVFNDEIITDRIFWIYFIVTFFFIIIGVASIIRSNISNMLIITIMWILSNVLLLIVVYHASKRWGPGGTDSQICFVDSNSGCFESGNRVWLVVNILFIVLLIISILWAAELNNTGNSLIRDISGLIMILGSLILFWLAVDTQQFSQCIYDDFQLLSWIGIIFTIIWIVLSLSVII